MKSYKRLNRFTDLVCDCRGAATTESVIAAMFFVACFALSLWTYQRYALAMGVSRDVRTELWAQASPGCDSGRMDTHLRGAFPSYEAQQVRLAPVLSPYHETPRVQRIDSSGSGHTTSSAYLGRLAFEYHTGLSTTCNELADTPEDQLGYATVDTYCRVSEIVCSPDQARELAGEP